MTHGGDIILGRIILPIVGFKTDVLMNALFGKTTNSTGGILMSIRGKFWIGVFIHTTISWCLAFYLIWVIY